MLGASESEPTVAGRAYPASGRETCELSVAEKQLAHDHHEQLDRPHDENRDAEHEGKEKETRGTVNTPAPDISICAADEHKADQVDRYRQQSFDDPSLGEHVE